MRLSIVSWPFFIFFLFKVTEECIWVWWLTFVIPALTRQRQEDCKFKVGMCCIEKCQANLGYKERLCITVSLAVTKCCTNQLVERRVCVGHSLQMQSIVSGKSWQQALQAAVKEEDTVFTVREQREECCCSAYHLAFIQPETSSHWRTACSM